jgi:ribosomal protein S6--L-glutamate ligase
VNICLITDRPGHPVLAGVMAELAARHQVRVLNSADPSAVGSAMKSELGRPADVYLLRSHVPAVVAFVSTLEAAGALVVNACGATALCADRVELTGRVVAADLPWPRTLSAVDLQTLAGYETGVHELLPYPVVVKSRLSRRGDLVQRVDSIEQLRELKAAWPAEPVIVQEYVENDGFDRKLYVVDDLVLGVSCASQLSVEDRQARTEIAVPPAWERLALAAGRVLGLRVYGVDVVLAARGPKIVDVNAFPGFRGVPGACEALVGMVDRLATSAAATA